MTYQQITIVGNVGRDPEIKYLKDGVAVADFSVAVSKVTGRGEARKETTTWFKVTFWRERAELVSTLVKKGTKILVVGEVNASAYVDKKTGDARASLEITASEFKLLSSKGEVSGGYAEESQTGGGRQNNQRYSENTEPVYTDSEDVPF